MSEEAHTREQYHEAIAAALRARDMVAAAALIRRLAVHWPDDAELIAATVAYAKDPARRLTGRNTMPSGEVMPHA